MPREDAAKFTLECVLLSIGYSQIDPVTKHSVAIKKGYSKNRSSYGVSATLIREIGILRELMIYHHPNIVNVIV